MDKNPSGSFGSGKHLFPMKSLINRRQSEKSAKQHTFSAKESKKGIPDQQSSKIILNYFLFNNFQDFNTWQQIAKTKTDYRFDQVDSQRIECELTFKWDSSERETIITKGNAKNRRHAKRKVLTMLIQCLIHKGWIGHGFKDTRFIDKLPRRKKYESSQSQDQNSQLRHSKRLNIYSILKEDNHLKALEALNTQNVIQVWSYALFNKDVTFCSQVLNVFFGGNLHVQNIAHYEQPIQKQVSYLEQQKDPFQEDLTVFIRYYQLQRPQYREQNFNHYQINTQHSINMHLPSQKFVLNQRKIIKFQCFQRFQTIQQKADFLAKKHKFSQKKEKGFFAQQKQIKMPNFEEAIISERCYSFNLIDKMFNQVLYACNDYIFCLKVLGMLQDSLKDVSFGHKANPVKLSEYKQVSQKQVKMSDKSQRYYKDTKMKLITQMLHNLKVKQSKQNMKRLNSIQGMINYSAAHSKYEGIFQFIPKQPQQVLCKKIQRKCNFSEFYQQNQFCTQQLVLLINKLDQTAYVGIVKQLNQSFKIHLPFILFPQNDFPAPFTIHKLLNGKIYNKLSSALNHTSKYYMDYVQESANKENNVVLIYQTPSGPHIQVIQELLAEWIARRMFSLIVSQNYQIIHKKLTQNGFKCLKISTNSDQKQVSRHNIICTSPLNVCTDLMKNIAFDRVIIDQAQSVPQVISLMSIVKCTKRVYLIGDPNLPRSQMKCPASKQNDIDKSLFEKFLQLKYQYLAIKDSQGKQTNPQKRVFDESVVEWLKKSVYIKDLITNEQTTFRRKTPLIKGFNWPSVDYRLCMLNVKNKKKSESAFINQQCFLITWIIAQVLKSGFTELQQISCCCLSSTTIPIFQQHLVGIFTKLNIQPLQWAKAFQHMIRPLDGSRFNSNDLVILFASGGPQVNLNGNDTQMLKKLNSALLQAERGLIIVGDIEQLSKRSKAWDNFINWMASKKLILCYSTQN